MFDESPIGSVDSIDSRQALEVLGLRWRTGKLQVLADGDSFGLFVDCGRIILATSSHRTLRLGQMLLQRGAVQPLDLYQILKNEDAAARSRALGGVLVAEGTISRSDLAAGVEEQCVEILSRIIELSRSTLLFVHDDPLPQGLEVVPLDTDRLLQRADLRQSERSAMRAMQRLLPRPDAPLRFAGRLPLVSFQLTDAELLVALSVDRGTSTLEQLAVTLPLDSLTLKRTVIALIERGFLLSSDPPPLAPLT